MRIEFACAALAACVCLAGCGEDGPGEKELGTIFIDAVNAPIPFLKKRTDFKLNSFRKIECKPSVEKTADRTVCLVRASFGNQPETDKFVVVYRDKDGKKVGTIDASFAEGAQLQQMMQQRKGK